MFHVAKHINYSDRQPHSPFF